MMGGALMAVFWLGTLPALSAVPWITHRLLRPASARAPKITALLLIVAGLAGIGFKMRSLWDQGGKAHCHCEVERGKK
jgi:sulfite exporter TauE/SafE